MAPSARWSSVVALLFTKARTFYLSRLCVVGFTCGYSWEVLCSSVRWLAQGASRNLPDEVAGVGLFLVAGIGYCYCWEGSAKCHFCVALGNSPPRAPMEMGCLAMGAYPQWFLWEGQVEFLNFWWCLFQVVGGDSHGFHEQLENHRGFAFVVYTLRNTGRGSFGQRAAVGIGWVLPILEAE